MPSHSIYALCDPAGGFPRYVGRTSFPLRHRLCNHIHDAKSGKSNRELSAWINGLVAINQRPSIVLLEECAPEEAPKTETAWIATCQRQGCDLLNKSQLYLPVVKTRKPPADRPELSLSGDALLEWYALRWGLSVIDFVSAIKLAMDNDISMQDAIDTLRLERAQAGDQ